MNIVGQIQVREAKLFYVGSEEGIRAVVQELCFHCIATCQKCKLGLCSSPAAQEALLSSGEEV